MFIKKNKILVILLALSGCGGNSVPPPVVYKGDDARNNIQESLGLGVEGKLYTVKDNDTLAKIASNKGVAIEDLARENHLEPPYSIVAGQKIKIPESHTDKLVTSGSVTVKQLDEPSKTSATQEKKITLGASEEPSSVDAEKIRNKQPEDLDKVLADKMAEAKLTSIDGKQSKGKDVAKPIPTALKKKKEDDDESANLADKKNTLEDSREKTKKNKTLSKSASSDGGQVLHEDSGTAVDVESKKKLDVEKRKIVVNNAKEIPENKEEEDASFGKEIPRVDGDKKQKADVKKPDINQNTSDDTTKDEKASAEESSKLIWPVKGKVLATFGQKSTDGSQSDGIRVQAPADTGVQSSSGGVVAYAGNRLKSYGNLVLVKHKNGIMTAYAHLDSIKVKKGDTIKRGHVIGTIGSTGDVHKPQLYFEVRKDKKPVDPMGYLEE